MNEKEFYNIIKELSPEGVEELTAYCYALLAKYQKPSASTAFDRLPKRIYKTE